MMDLTAVLFAQRSIPRPDQALTHVADLTSCLRATAYRRQFVCPHPEAAVEAYLGDYSVCTCCGESRSHKRGEKPFADHSKCQALMTNLGVQTAPEKHKHPGKTPYFAFPTDTAEVTA